MSNSDVAPSPSPAQTIESDAADATPPTPTPTFADSVNTLVSAMTKDDKGTLQFPTGDHSEELRYAAMAEKRRRDTHGSYTRSRQEIASLTAERDALQSHVTASTSAPALTTEQEKELADLKFSDPDAWHRRLREHESIAKETTTAALKTISTAAQESSELVRREGILSLYIEANPGFSLKDDDIPPRLSKRLETGEVSFEDFLGEVHTYLQTPKRVHTPETQAEPNLSNLAGNAAPSTLASTKATENSYAKTDIF